MGAPQTIVLAYAVGSSLSITKKAMQGAVLEQLLYCIVRSSDFSPSVLLRFQGRRHRIYSPGHYIVLYKYVLRLLFGTPALPKEKAGKLRRIRPHDANPLCFQSDSLHLCRPGPTHFSGYELNVTLYLVA